MVSEPTIKWRLAAVMADREMDYKELAEEMGYHPNTVSKLKNNLPDRLEMTTLLGLCQALKCQPGELMVYVEPEPEPEPQKKGRGRKSER